MVQEFLGKILCHLYIPVSKYFKHILFNKSFPKKLFYSLLIVLVYHPQGFETEVFDSLLVYDLCVADAACPLYLFKF